MACYKNKTKEITVDQRAQTVFDPMFAGARKAHTPVYVQRSSQYFSARRVIDYRSDKRALDPALSTMETGQPSTDVLGGPTPSLPERQTAHGSRSLQAIVGRMRVRIPDRQTTVLYVMAAVVFVTGLAVSLQGLRANHVVAAQVIHAQQTTLSSVNNSSNVVPSSVKPSEAAVAHYAVSPNEPRYIDIPKLGVHSEVLSEGVSSNNQLQVPWNIYDTGWYNASSQPGQPGAMLIDGHSGIDGLHGVFYKLATLVAGDQITITRGDGQKFTYMVAKTQVVSAKSVDMGSMLVSADTSKPGLNLITCTGDQIPGTDELNERVQVYAVMQ